MNKVDPTTVIDGVLMYWYTLHVCPRGTYNGLYCNHANPRHAEWEERKASYKANKKKNNLTQTNFVEKKVPNVNKK